jgi:hypothetical protein
MRTPLITLAVLTLATPSFARQAPVPGPASRDPGTCEEAWREAKASGATETEKVYVERCKQGGGALAAQTSFTNPSSKQLSAAVPMAPTATSHAPGPMPDGATALCKDGTYSMAQTHAQACKDAGGVEQFFK